MEINGKLKQYLRAPIYLVIVFVAIDIGFFFYDVAVGIAFLIFCVIYVLVLGIFYGVFKQRLESELISFAQEYAASQNILLDNFKVPYALLDGSGRIVWKNVLFSQLFDGKIGEYEHISKLFPEINNEVIKDSEKARITRLNHDNKCYDAFTEKLKLSDDRTGKLFSLDGGDHSLIAFTMFDVTELTQIKEENENLRMVPAIVYIDNYEETVENVETVKRALLVAVIDRKVNQYFQKVDGIVQKIEKDKYFVVFEHRYMAKLKEDRFSLLSDIKTIKVGNDSEVTISIGVGEDGKNYHENFEFAAAAINIALGRGGSQAVVKNKDGVSYFGMHGKQIEKNTRVKARVKAQALREIMEARSDVLVMGHKISDIDAFGAEVGVYVAARLLGKPVHIILNTITSSLRPVVDMILKMPGAPADLIINSETALNIVTPDSLVMVVDTNRSSYTECPKLINEKNTIVVFDHHRQGEGVIENPTLSYIEPYASSTCEMIAEVLQYFSDNVSIRPEEADAIYAGILIDTNNFVTKTGVRTFEAAAYLRRNGADMTRVRKLLRENMEAYKARAEVVRKAEVYRGIIAMSDFSSKDVESPTIIGAQAANELLDIIGIRASFVLTDYNGKIYVSARSIDDIDVQVIMEKLGGGGHINIAGAQLEGENISAVKNEIETIIDDMMEKGEIKE